MLEGSWSDNADLSFEQVWTFILENPTFKFENNTETVHASGKCRIVACKSGDATTK